MKVALAQFYTEPGACFRFSKKLKQTVAACVASHAGESASFDAVYGKDTLLIFRVGAKRSLPEAERRGPTAFPEDRQVEYTVFLPYDVIVHDHEPAVRCLTELMLSVRLVLVECGYAKEDVGKCLPGLLQSVREDPELLKV